MWTRSGRHSPARASAPLLVVLSTLAASVLDAAHVRECQESDEANTIYLPPGSRDGESWAYYVVIMFYPQDNAGPPVWRAVYEESNGVPGLQRDDECHDVMEDGTPYYYLSSADTPVVH